MRSSKLGFKQVIAWLVLTSFLAIAFYGFAIMPHGANEQMSGNCPFSIPGTVLCQPNGQTAVLHHLAAVYSFFNVPINLGAAASAALLLLAASVSLALFVNPLVLAPPARKNRFHNFSFLIPYDRKAVSWLSFKASVF